MRRLAPVHRYVLAVSALGSAAFAFVVGSGLGRMLSAEALLFGTFVVFGELLPITVPRQGEQDEITTSTTFALALLLTAGLGPAVAAQVAGSVVSDVVRRKPPWKCVFNAAQYVLALCAAAAVLRALTSRPELGSFVLDRLPATLAAGAAFFLMNTSLTGVALALAQDVPVGRYLWRDVRNQLPTDGVLLVLTPILLLTAQTSLWLVPLIVVPMVAVYTSTRVSLENSSLVRRLEESLADLQELNRLNEHQALHDALTGLPNRTLFVDRVTQAIRVAKREGHALAVLIIDLDRFKDINDTLGHHDGDVLLREIAARLRGALRESDTIARVGGDEFGVLVPSIRGTGSATRVADRIREALDEPVAVEGLVLHVEASIGIAMYPDHGQNADVLMQRADLAMYVAKSGTLGCQMYAARLDRHSRSRVTLLGELRHAIEDGQLVLHYQPKVSLATGDVVGMEALVRWCHPTRTLIPPDEFIPFAERTGLIRTLTQHVIRTALEQSRTWREQGLDIPIAVNLSARNVIDLQLPADVAAELGRTGVPADRLELEITESALMGEPGRAREVLTRLSAMGVTLSLDDFGTGYSSLASLQRLPVHEIKIDRSFVMNMSVAENDAMIVRSTVDLGHNLGLQVVAEGVETEDIWDRLVELRCDVAQGFFMSRPLPPADVPGWIRGVAARGAANGATPVPPTPAALVKAG